MAWLAGAFCSHDDWLLSLLDCIMIVTVRNAVASL